MLYVHEENIRNKITTNYNKRGAEIERFMHESYLPMREKIFELRFAKSETKNFITAANIFNNYYEEIESFSNKYGIKAQSKFASTFYEEISSYLFKDLPEIKNNIYGIYNKKIYAGLKIDNNQKIGIIPKDVDFCIGKKVNISIDEQTPVELILPIVAVEVKTYLDATMFGEIKSSSKSIRSASPNSKAYVLMGYKCIADEHIVAARQDATLTEMFVLRKDENSPIDSEALYQYFCEICDAVSSISDETIIKTPGKLLFPGK